MDIVEADLAQVEPTEPAIESDSLAEHEAAFGSPSLVAPPIANTPTETAAERAARDDAGRFSRHRAQSQKASPEDVEQINALTKELRTKEAELAKIKPDALSGSPRILALRRQIRAIETDLTNLAPKPPAEPRSEPAPAPRSPAPVTDSKKPTWTTFEGEIGTKYQTWAEAQDAYVDARDDWKDAQAQIAQQTQAQQQETTKLLTDHHTRMRTFLTAKPDAQTAIATFSERILPAPLVMAIVKDDNGPEFAYYLETHPEQFDELFLATDGKEPTDLLVATVQRRLRTRMQAVNTGSAAPYRAPSPAPRPPNPVRTGPMNTGEDLPGDASSLADHERAFGPKRSR